MNKASRIHVLLHEKEAKHQENGYILRCVIIGKCLNSTSYSLGDLSNTEATDVLGTLILAPKLDEDSLLQSKV